MYGAQSVLHDNGPSPCGGEPGWYLVPRVRGCERGCERGRACERERVRACERGLVALNKPISMRSQR